MEKCEHQPSMECRFHHSASEFWYASTEEELSTIMRTTSCWWICWIITAIFEIDVLIIDCLRVRWSAPMIKGPIETISDGPRKLKLVSLNHTHNNHKIRILKIARNDPLVSMINISWALLLSMMSTMKLNVWKWTSGGQHHIFGNFFSHFVSLNFSLY
jgi:hypothetical protein